MTIHTRSKNIVPNCTLQNYRPVLAAAIQRIAFRMAAQTWSSQSFYGMLRQQQLAASEWDSEYFGQRIAFRMAAQTWSAQSFYCMFQRHQLASTGHIGVGFETINGQLYLAELSASSRSGDSKDRLQNGSSDLILAILLLHAPTTTAGSIGVRFGILWPTDRL